MVKLDERWLYQVYFKARFRHDTKIMTKVVFLYRGFWNSTKFYTEIYEVKETTNREIAILKLTLKLVQGLGLKVEKIPTRNIDGLEFYLNPEDWRFSVTIRCVGYDKYERATMVREAHLLELTKRLLDKLTKSYKAYLK